MDRIRAVEILRQVIHGGARHPWYDRTTSLASLYRKLVTGDGLDALLQQFVKREDQQAFEQRKALTNHVVTTVVANLMDTMRKIPRSNYQRVLELLDENRLSQLEKIISKFWGSRSLDDYVKSRWLELNATDPNSFIVVEFGPFDYTKERAQSYPFEVSSHDAVDYAYQNNVLQYLVARTTFPMPTKTDASKKGEKYTAYLPNETFSFVELNPDTAPKLGLKDGEMTPFSDQGGYLLTGNRIFQYTFGTPHDAGEVPAVPCGYMRDQWTGGMTFVAPYEKAVPILNKSIKVNSEMDLTMSLSAFPFRAEYAPKCDELDCHNGYLTDGTSKCPVCKGTGHKSVTSAQEKLVLSLPKDAQDMLDLDKLIVFKHPPVDILKFQKEYVDGLTEACKAAMFNSESFTRKQVSDTATGKRLDLDNVYDTLFDCAMGYASAWKFLVVFTARFAELENGLIAELVFSKDFKLKGLNELLSDLESANRSEAGPAVKQSIQQDISRLIYADNPREFQKWNVRNRFNPFSGYSEAETSMALSDPSVPARYKVQYLMLGVIFDELEEEAAISGRDFYAIEPQEQRRLVAQKVAAYQAETQSAPTLPVDVSRVAQDDEDQ